MSNDGNKIIAKCVNCKKMYSSTSCSTTNFLKHLRIAHQSLILAYDKHKANYKGPVKQIRISEGESAITQVQALNAESTSKNEMIAMSWKKSGSTSYKSYCLCRSSIAVS